jgi:hypothetical protein
VPQTLRLAATIVEELEHPRPHYRVDVRGAVTAISGISDPTAGLLPDEVVMTVHVPADVGSDLIIIKQAAKRRALALLETLVEAENLAVRSAAPADPLDAKIG